MKKQLNIAAMLIDLDSNELKELRRELSAEISSTITRIAERESAEKRAFIDGLQLHRGYDSGDREVVSLNRRFLTMEQSRNLRDISDRIGKAFADLDQLKTDVAIEALRNHVSFSKVFKTTVKRMKKYRSR